MHSIAARLLVSAGIWVIGILVLAGAVLNALFRDSVTDTFDQRLEAHMERVIAAASADSATALLSVDSLDFLDAKDTDFDSFAVDLQVRELDTPSFERPYSGWYWQIDSQAGHTLARSRSLWDTSLVLPADLSLGEQRILTTLGPDGERLRVLMRHIRLPGASDGLHFALAIRTAELQAELERFQHTLRSALIVLGLGLLLGTFLQVRFGLEPLHRIGEELRRIRSGGADRLTDRYPRELAPMVNEMNDLLDHSAAVVERARTHAGNLAHALKTPLAVLINESGNQHTPLADTVRRQTESMRRQIDHHLARSRAAATARVMTARTDVDATLNTLKRTLEKMYQPKGVSIEVRGAVSVPAFRGEREDLEEMLGNLMDNACKYALGRVRARVTREFNTLKFTIEDDGPGLSEAEWLTALKRGHRLDETVPGSGLGLAIVSDMATLYGGELSMARSSLGGLAVRLRLPAAETP
ncbi:MAG: ATP-binding protein [Geminicoccaceae bacterium]